MKIKLCFVFASLLLLVGCKNEKIDSSMLSSKSNISQEMIEQSNHLDRASYAGMEHIFADTENIVSNGRFVLLIFGRNGCHWCERLKEEIKGNQMTQEMLAKDFQTYYINLSYSKLHHLDFDGKIDEKTTRTFGAEYAIRSTPTSIFLDSKGNAILGWPGYFSQEQMQVILQFIASKEYQKAKNQEDFYKMLSQRLKEVR